MQNSKITKISDREHLHLRKELYIGNCNTVKEKHWMLDSSMNLKYTETLYNEGYIKLVYEIIDNSIDEYIKTGGKFSNKIDVDISDEKSVTVIDNGRGIPSSKDKATGKYQTELAFCDLKAGSNWERTSSIGMNGIGGSAVNMLSSSFIVNSCDGKYTSSLGCSGNCDSIKFKRTKGGKKGTKVVFSIDEKHFDGAQYFNVDIIRNIVLKRLLILNTTYKKIKLTFNGHKITNTIWDCLAISDGLFVNKGDIDINVYPIGSVKYDDISTINGLDTYRGGTHLRYIKSEIMTYVRDKINKKHKLNIKNSDLYDKFMFGVMFRDFPIPEFNTQNKTELINKEADVREYIKKNGLNLDDIAKKLYSTFSKEISEIVDMFQYKSIAKKSKSVAKGKKMSNDSNSSSMRSIKTERVLRYS